ncbi:FkbM family methyltransferase [Methylorubrum extorquens]|uniref:FkbM family methyltransferase n=1 Tax=Methylorubrum extorquens TaxID=408 RepID=UPI00209FCD0A|nr:FkbM family methyltransferase [Methylorubrum extorquens]MCP1535742.1 FkbM family methyltransferase [Methylorubrum extorquens]
MANLIHAVTRLRRRLRKVSPVKIDGRTFAIPHKGNFHVSHLDGHEDYLNDFIKAIVEMKGGTFVDVGVNVGQILLKLRSFDRERDYIGFEVSVSCCDYVNQIIDHNDIKNSIVVPLGLSESRGTITLHFSDQSDPQATLVGDFWTAANRRKFERRVYVESGDTILDAAGTGPVGVIKIDVEGGELEVLRGLRSTLGRDQPIIVMEILPYLTEVAEAEAATMERRKERCLQLEALLEEAGYLRFRALPGFKIEEATTFGAPTFEATRTNYVMVPHRDEGQFRALFNG